MASCTPSPNRGASARWPTSARNPRSDRDTTSPRANRLYGGDPPGSACRRRQAFCSRKPVTNAARPTAGRSKRGLRVGVRPCAGLRGIGRDLPVVVVRDHQQTDVVIEENQPDGNKSRTLHPSSDTVSPLNLKYSDSTAEKVPVLVGRLSLPPIASAHN